jgi:hypothetical protein
MEAAVYVHEEGAMPHNARMDFVFLNHLNHFGERRMGAHGAIRWPARSPHLNPLDFFIFIRNFRDNVYLTPSGTQKKLRKKIVGVWSGKTPKFFTECKGGHF